MPVRASASPPPRLVETLPGVRRTTLATVICGEIATRFDCPSSYLRVLHALVSHAGWHSNRVWASQERLAQLAGAVRGICLKTVQRAIRWLVKTVGLRIISDPAERLRGPGEHVYVESGNQKLGEKSVNHYDLSALRGFVPAELTTREVPSPTSLPDRIDLPDPFLFPATTQAPNTCPVDTDRGKGWEPEKARSEAPRPPGFERTKLSSIRERNNETSGNRALAVLGVSLTGRKAILQTLGESWAAKAALYARLQNERGEVRTTPAAYLVAVYKTWLAEKAAGVTPGWPDWLEIRWERERATADRIVRAEQSQGNQETRRVISRPGPLPGSPTTPDPLTALTGEQKAVVFADARAALRRSLPGAPTALIERLLPGYLAKKESQKTASKTRT